MEHPRHGHLTLHFVVVVEVISFDSRLIQNRGNAAPVLLLTRGTTLRNPIRHAFYNESLGYTPVCERKVSMLRARVKAGIAGTALNLRYFV